MKKIKNFNAEDYLTDEEIISNYLKYALAEDDKKYLIKARENIKKAREQNKRNRNKAASFDSTN